MRRTLAVLMVVGLFAAAAPAAITHTATYVGSYTIGIGTGPVVDMYEVSFDAGAGRKMGSFVLEIGTVAGLGGQDMFHAAWVTGGKTPVTNLTPTKDAADFYLLPVDASKCYEADSHFLPAGIAGWAPSVVAPIETNDGSIYSGGAEDYKAGVGTLRMSVAVPNENRTQSILTMRIGVLNSSAQGVWVSSGSADDLGVVSPDSFLLPPIPEPATLSLLGLGALALMRRRRI